MHLIQFCLVTIYWQIISFNNLQHELVSSFYFKTKAIYIYHLAVTRQKPNKMHHCEISFQMYLCETKKNIFYSPKEVTNTIVRQTSKTLGKATQKVQAEVITRRRACALLALKMLKMFDINNGKKG